jgi:hypothetical protein
MTESTAESIVREYAERLFHFCLRKCGSANFTRAA